MQPRKKKSPLLKFIEDVPQDLWCRLPNSRFYFRLNFNLQSHDSCCNFFAGTLLRYLQKFLSLFECVELEIEF